MANLSITSVCNRKCEYCFAQGAFERHQIGVDYMTPDVFDSALDFLDRSDIDQARLLGGEPTMHPRFAEMVDLAMKRGFRILIFSNALMSEPALARLERISPERLDVLVNVCDKNDLSADQVERRTATFRRLGRRVTLGMNIDTPAVRMESLLEMIEEFGLAHDIRFGLAHPGVNGANRSLHPRYYPLVGEKLVEFASHAQELNVNYHLDCGFVPCMFPEGALNAMGITPDDVGRCCNPTLDILPNGAIIACYPLAHEYLENLPADKDAPWVINRFEARLAPYRRLGIFKKCAGCPVRERGDCRAGCLAVTLRRLHHTSFEVQVMEGIEGDRHSGSGAGTAKHIQGVES